MCLIRFSEKRTLKIRAFVEEILWEVYLKPHMIMLTQKLRRISLTNITINLSIFSGTGSIPKQNKYITTEFSRLLLCEYNFLCASLETGPTLQRKFVRNLIWNLGLHYSGSSSLIWYEAAGTLDLASCLCRKLQKTADRRSDTDRIRTFISSQSL
jgi:hypothetical protein